jgi:hypothetical protein
VSRPPSGQENRREHWICIAAFFFFLAKNPSNSTITKQRTKRNNRPSWFQNRVTEFVIATHKHGAISAGLLRE